MTNAPAGWYDDGEGRQRWWDGTVWTEQYLPSAGPDAGAQMQLETKSLRLLLGTKKGDREFEKLLGDGWTVASKVHRKIFQFDPAATDLVLTRLAKVRAKR